MTYRETADDLHRKWEGTYCYLNGTDLVYLNNITHGDGKFVAKAVALRPDKSKKVELFTGGDLSPIELLPGFYNVGPPPKGAEALNHVCWRVERRARRSPVIGLNTRNYILMSPYNIFRNRYFGRATTMGWSFELLQQVLNPGDYPSVESAWENVPQAGVLALSRQYAIGVSCVTDPSTPLLFSTYGPIGTLRQPDDWHIFTSHSFQEVLDFVTRSNLKVKLTRADA